MSNSCLPAEMLDHVVDHLHSARDVLKNCCLVSKSWIPRTRKHLFANIALNMGSLQSWKKKFPDPSTSPACYTKSLFIHRPRLIIAEAGSLIRSFSRVEHLVMHTHVLDFDQSATHLVPLHGFSPVVKSINMTFLAFPLRQIFNLILSFPLLKDLAVAACRQILANNGDDSREDEMPTTAQASILPMFTGTLNPYLKGGMELFSRRLLSLPGGIRFRKLILTYRQEEDLSSMMALVEGCSHTLKSLNITWDLHDEPGSAPIDLSKATKLGDVVFQPQPQSVKWGTMALQTITSKHQDLRQILIHIPHDLPVSRVLAHVRQTIGEASYEKWLDLDCLLVQFWESRSIRPKLISMTKRDAEASIVHFLLEITKRGIFDLIEH